MSARLPKACQHVLRATEALMSEKGYAPSLREIADRVGLISTSTVHAHLRKLRRFGRVTWDQGRPRTLRILPQPPAEGMQ